MWLLVTLSSVLLHGQSGDVDPGEQYVGSEACRDCHTQIYETWSTTRHSYSVLPAQEAAQAGYPLPHARLGGKTPGVQKWGDVSYVIGGRQRITYVDKTGQVEDTSYHHRIGKWNAFPAKKMSDCGSCHFTGFGVGRKHEDDAALPGRWIERNIGCESCHGPGKRHTETYDQEDIVVDSSSRACGDCHTAAGRVLPKDDFHDTHDLVQFWNQDPHVTGLQFHSHNAFCSRCHSPFRGHFLESTDGTEIRIFTEERESLTCIGCHDPHDLSNAHYSRQQVALRPPLPPKFHAYKGNDEDFTTTDFTQLQSSEEVCLQCHTGADRIDLDHAQATCNDCHNSFKRNRNLESRVLNDASHRRLSCRPCHEDADHLMTILFGDPDFLQPRNIHNLRTLPAAVIMKYGFKYPGLRPQNPSELPADPGGFSYPDEAHPVTSADSQEGENAAEVRVEWRLRTRKELRQLFSEGIHYELSSDQEIAAHQASVLEKPGYIGHYVSLALAYVKRRQQDAGRDVLEYAASLESTWVIPGLPFKTVLPRDPPPKEERDKIRSITRGLLPPAREPKGDTTRLWLQSYLEMAKGRFADAAETLAAASKVDPESAGLRFYRGLAKLGQLRYDAAIETFESVIEARPDHLPARVALGFLHLQRRRFAPARRELEKVIAVAPEEPIANYLLGRGYLRQRDSSRATHALQASLSSTPDFVDAWLALARAHRLAGFSGPTIDAYREIIRRRPDEFQPHYQLAKELKLLSDKAAFQLQSDEETAPPPGVSSHQWKRYLLALKRRSGEYGQLALSQFTQAIDIRPLDADGVRQIGEIYRRMGRREQALACFESLARREPDVWIHHYRSGTILIQLGRYDEATRKLAQAMPLEPTRGEFYLALGLAYVRSDQLKKAIATFEQGTLYEPFNPTLYNNLGAAYAREGQFQRARQALERSLELATFPLPRSHLNYTNLALIHLKEGRRGPAIQALKNAIRIYPDYTYSRRLLGLVQSHSVDDVLSAEPRAEFVFNDLLEIFGEVSTVVLDHD